MAKTAIVRVTGPIGRGVCSKGVLADSVGHFDQASPRRLVAFDWYRHSV